MSNLAELEYDDCGIANLKIGETGWTIRVVKRESRISGWPEYATYFIHDTCHAVNGWGATRDCYKCDEPVPPQAVFFNKMFKLRI